MSFEKQLTELLNKHFIETGCAVKDLTIHWIKSEPIGGKPYVVVGTIDSSHSYLPSHGGTPNNAH